MSSIAVFCGSSTGFNEVYATAARGLATEMVRRDVRLVYGAGSIGLMGVLADEVLRLGGKVLGVIPQFLVDREVGHRGLTELVVTESMHERKLLMAENSDAFIAMPGGIGTLEEIIEVFTWTQIGIHDKPCGLLNTRNYYGNLTRQLEHMSNEGFLKPANVRQLAIEDDGAALLERLLG
ncbi:MAG: TIGR00730 family Rossman fold protein [Lewinella sp.]